jgi:hypothetical protein
VTTQHCEDPLRAAESLIFFGVTGRGTVQQRELFRLMERTGPQWWRPAAGMTREQFWTTRQCALMARSSTIRILQSGCRPNDQVTVEHVITHGRRERPQREPEYGFVDELRVLREADGAVLADLTMNTVWVDAGENGPRIAPAPPRGLNCPLRELPAIEPLPAVAEPLATARFHWTERECDVTNRHVSFPSYVERAENALADAGLAMPERPVWQGWYRYEFVGDDWATVTASRDGGAFVLGFRRDEERRPRVVLRLADADS